MPEFAITRQGITRDGVVINPGTPEWREYQEQLERGIRPRYHQDPSDLAEVTRRRIVEQLADTDREMARIGEDLITILVNKTILSAADFPQIVWQKIQRRKALREQLQGGM